jgi:hypothetical protein
VAKPSATAPKPPDFALRASPRSPLAIPPRASARGILAKASEGGSTKSPRHIWPSNPKSSYSIFLLVIVQIFLKIEHEIKAPFDPLDESVFQHHFVDNFSTEDASPTEKLFVGIIKFLIDPPTVTPMHLIQATLLRTNHGVP